MLCVFAADNGVCMKCIVVDYCVLCQSSVAVKVDRETGNAGSVLTVAGFDVQVNCLFHFIICYITFGPP